ncbi:uncharacterized protein CEXT_106151 [Caerostris extrusa]|uniref:Uncharacterized protein n=1 Tax=Caerostris extrusa TaxID=172846 RepID=A0AAV4RSU7_CAEEX|nr:uncharacterized protein CEXT_106151 [Caerostris extrusa]
MLIHLTTIKHQTSALYLYLCLHLVFSCLKEKKISTELNLELYAFHQAPDWLTGGLFESGDEDLELAFRYAVDHVNADTNVLPLNRLQAHVERVEKHDSFTASKKGLVSHQCITLVIHR